jgi:hypothetical protein
VRILGGPRVGGPLARKKFCALLPRQQAESEKQRTLARSLPDAMTFC